MEYRVFTPEDVINPQRAETIRILNENGVVFSAPEWFERSKPDKSS